MPLEEKYLQLIQSAVPHANGAALERLSMLYDRIVATNEKINITSLTSPVDVATKHIIDSLALLSYPAFEKSVRDGKTICDVGCGGGFPGLPLACVFPELPLTMIDSTEKKITALKENVSLLGLDNVLPVWGRGEEIASAKGGEHREHYDICVSRAVARLPVLCELCLPFVKTGGSFIALKGMKAKEELEESMHAIPVLGGKLVEMKEILLPSKFAEGMNFNEEEMAKIHDFAEASRYLIVIKKIKPTKPTYPRTWSQMTKKPL